MGTTIAQQAFMTRSIDLGTTLQQLGFLGFPSSQFGSIRDVVEPLVISDEQVAVEVGRPMAPFIAMQTDGEY